MAKTAKDLTLAEAVAAFQAIAKAATSKCEIYPSLTQRGSGLVFASIYPEGITARTQLTARADTWRDLAAKCEAALTDHADLHAATVTREMALKIISLTADFGECTDAALRAEFAAADVARFGERACAQATEMASNGPFSIVSLAGANQMAA